MLAAEATLSSQGKFYTFKFTVTYSISSSWMLSYINVGFLFYFILFFLQKYCKEYILYLLISGCKCKFSSLICITAIYMSLNRIRIDIKRNYDYLRLDLPPNVIKASLCSYFKFIGKSWINMQRKERETSELCFPFYYNCFWSNFLEM